MTMRRRSCFTYGLASLLISSSLLLVYVHYPEVDVTANQRKWINRWRTIHGEVFDRVQWLEKERATLELLLQRRLHYVQNPRDCLNAKKLLCKIGDRPCGFGCQLHHVIWCLMVSYGMERTLILQSEGWRYSRDGWGTVFKPVSETCTSLSPKEIPVHWNDINTVDSAPQEHPVIYLPTVDRVRHPPPFLPFSIPEDIAPRLRNITSDPPVWFIGQLAKYLMRPHPFLEDHFLNRTQELRFEKPVVGLQIRRTDKLLNEAQYHPIEEYMGFVERWFSKKERQAAGSIPIRRVFIATDDPSVISEAIRKYPNYTFIGDSLVATRADCPTRYNKNGLISLLDDIYFLSQSDYIVCTFSSHMCRVPFEIMHTMHMNTSQIVHSLDDKFWMEGELRQRQVVKYPLYSDVS